MSLKKYITLTLLVLCLLIHSCNPIGLDDNDGSDPSASPPGPDKSPPLLNSIVFTPAEGITGEGIITVDIAAEDAGSGIKEGFISISSPRFLETLYYGARLRGDLLFNESSGTWQAKVKVENYHESGRWKVGRIGLSDFAGNFRYYEYNNAKSTTHLYDSYINTLTDIPVPGLNVAGTNEDTTSPEVTGITINPSPLTGPGEVTFSFDIIEEGSGIQAGHAYFSSPGNLDDSNIGKELGGQFEYNESEDKWQVTFKIENYYESGLWKLKTIYLNDKAGNRSLYSYGSKKSTTHFYDSDYNRLTGLAVPELAVSGTNADLIAPEVTGITVTPSRLNGPGEVIFSFDITEEESGIDSGYIYVTSPRGLENNRDGGLLEGIIEYNESSGTWQAKIKIKKHHESGRWKLTYINLEDKAGNLSNYLYYSDESPTHFYNPINNRLTGLAVPELVVSGTNADLTAPEVTGITVTPSSLTGPGKVTFSFDITEESGTVAGYIRVSSPRRLLNGYGSGIQLSDELVYNRLTRKWEASVMLKSQHESGQWKLTAISLRDSSENFTSYEYEPDKSTTHFYESIQNEVTSLPVPEITLSGTGTDTTAPELTGITAEPSSQTGPGEVTFFLDITEEESGLEKGYIDLSSPANLENNNSGEILRGYLRYNNLTGKWRASVDIKNYYESGLWKVSKVELTDHMGNRAIYSYKKSKSETHYYLSRKNEVTSLPVHEFTVSGTAIDLVAPEVTGISVNPSSLTGPGEVTFSFDITEEGSGVDSGYISVTNPRGLIDYHSSIQLEGDLEYNPSSGKWETTVKLESHHESGQWTMTGIRLRDKAGNYKHYSYDKDESTAYFFDQKKDEVSSLPFPVITLSGTDVDITAPVVTGITVTPSHPTGPGEITFSFDITEEGSGIEKGSVTISSPAGLENSDSVEPLTSDLEYNESEGKWQAKITIENYHESGSWKLTRIRLQDKTENRTIYEYWPGGSETYFYTFLNGGYEQSDLEVPLFTLTGTESDLTAPELTGLTVSTSTISSYGQVLFSFDITEAESGIKEGSIVLSSPSVLAGGSGSAIFDTITYNETAGVWEASVTFNGDEEAGDWKPGRICLVDKAGNRSYYSIENDKSSTHLYDNYKKEVSLIEIPVITKQ